MKKAFSWWEDEDENPDIAYKDFSRRKLLFDFGAHKNRRKSDVSICTFKMDNVGVEGFGEIFFSSICLSRPTPHQMVFWRLFLASC